ncbi:MAG TPA: EamA family transporter [Lentisphaeria bacterium]|nr:MAG: putative DMT superfamily transporter inner membrane protein [Lentisphaerae bacterium ADurb.Bin082]HPY90503.1 EamA family transporter [Lentisphaeria bacterium]HQL87386.1 EamA family transporter [Lentisphaeria bacterium]
MIYLLIVSLIWSFSFVIIKGGLTGLDPNFVSAVRLTLSALTFLPFFRPGKLSWRDMAELAALGAVQFGLMYSLYIASFAWLPAYMSALLTTTTPLFVVFFNMVFTRRNVPAFWLAALLAIVGGVILKWTPAQMTVNWFGVLLLQLSNVAFALGLIWYRRLLAAHPDWDEKSLYFIIYAGAAAICALLMLFTMPEGTFRAVTARQWWLLAYLGVVASGISFFLFNKGATMVNPGVLAIMNNVKIPGGVIVALIVLQEKCHYPALAVSLMLFLAALYLCLGKPARPEAEAEPKPES